MQAYFWILALGVVTFLTAATGISHAAAGKFGRERDWVKDLLRRVDGWWALVLVGMPFLAIGHLATTLLFAVLSFLVLREFLSLTPTRPSDRLALFMAFFVAIPLQYFLVATGWYGLFSVLIPVYGFFALSTVSIISQDTSDFLERNGKIQWAVMVCVYALSHAPALLFLDIPGYGRDRAELLLFFLLVVQLSDVAQYVWGKFCGRRQLAPVLAPGKTWLGLLGGGATAVGIGALLHSFTPFSAWQAAVLSAVIVAGGVIGGLALSAVKRSLGAQDWGRSAQGHGGLLDRLDSVAFSAPLFFHVTRFFFVP